MGIFFNYKKTFIQKCKYKKNYKSIFSTEPSAECGEDCSAQGAHTCITNTNIFTFDTQSYRIFDRTVSIYVILCLKQHQIGS